MVGVARFVIPKEFICILFQVTKTEHYLKFVTVVAPSSPVSLAVLSVRTRTSALGILACATAQVMCHPPARHWTSGDLFDIRGAVYVEHDGHAKTLDGSSTLHTKLHTHCAHSSTPSKSVEKSASFSERELRESRVSVSLSSAQK